MNAKQAIQSVWAFVKVELKRFQALTGAPFVKSWATFGSLPRF
jgi:hypothetical protein